MDAKTLEQLAKVSGLIHDQDVAELKETQRQLRKLLTKQAELDKRPGQLIDHSEMNGPNISAHAIWSNSSDIARQKLEDEINELRQNLTSNLERSRSSFSRVSGLEEIRARKAADMSAEKSKREEISNEALIASKPRK